VFLIRHSGESRNPENSPGTFYVITQFRKCWVPDAGPSPAWRFRDFLRDCHILASKRNGIIYIGVTSDLIKRIWEHKNNMDEGFYQMLRWIHQLVWHEVHESMESAIEREKRLKEWKRKWKLELI